MGIMQVTFCRHGRVDFDDVARFKGHGRDLVPLSEEGLRDASKAAELLAGSPPDLIISSPMTRALQTAMVIGTRSHRPVHVELDLHEWTPHVGQQWNDAEVPGTAYADMRAFAGEWPAGETREWEPLSAVRTRVSRVLDRYTHVASLLVVTHSVVIEAMTGVRGTQFCEPVTWQRHT
jgi:broad specificity phosphatase PhoE